MALAESLVREGCVYAVCWGPESSTVEEAFDYADIAANPDSDDSHVVMTTSHDHDSLAEALFFVSESTQPVQRYVSTCKHLLVIVVAELASELAIRAYFENPENAGEHRVAADWLRSPLNLISLGTTATQERRPWLDRRTRRLPRTLDRLRPTRDPRSIVAAYAASRIDSRGPNAVATGSVTTRAGTFSSRLPGQLLPEPSALHALRRSPCGGARGFLEDLLCLPRGIRNRTLRALRDERVQLREAGEPAGVRAHEVRSLWGDHQPWRRWLLSTGKGVLV